MAIMAAFERVRGEVIVTLDADLQNPPRGLYHGVPGVGVAVDKPVIVDVPTYRFENCYPMIPAGGCNHEMILEDPPELKKKQTGTGKVTPEDKDTVLTA